MSLEPALTAEQWAAFPSWSRSAEPEPGEEPLYHRTKHGIAAANLHGQPFGFTREDVNDLRDIGAEGGWKVLHSIADRIEALLPPED